MDSGLIGKVEKAKRYAEDRHRFHFNKFDLISTAIIVNTTFYTITAFLPATANSSLPTSDAVTPWRSRYCSKI